MPLPKIGLDYTDFGSYLIIGTKRKWHQRVQRKISGESATSRRSGLAKHMRGHQLAISLIRSGRKKVQVARRYAFAFGHRVVSIFFFIVSRILISDLVDLSRTFSVLTEDLIQVY
jgi:hypothetical protein